MAYKNKPDLMKMNLPSDLKKLSLQQCDDLCKQIRKLLITTVSKNGGHLASNLGTVEEFSTRLKIRSSGMWGIRLIHIKF